MKSKEYFREYRRRSKWKLGMKDRREYFREYYRKNPEKMKILNERRTEYRRIYWHLRTDEFQSMKSLVGCKKCGTSDGRVLEFHHREPKEKKFEIGVSNYATKELDELLIEVGKCDVLCANCHRIVEWESRRGSRKEVGENPKCELTPFTPSQLSPLPDIEK